MFEKKCSNCRHLYKVYFGKICDKGWEPSKEEKNHCLGYQRDLTVPLIFVLVILLLVLLFF